MSKNRKGSNNKHQEICTVSVALDFRNEDVIIFGETVPLLVTKLHYALP